MNDNRKLKDYINESLMSLYRLSRDDNMTATLKHDVEIQIAIFERIKVICELRGRY